MTMKNAALGVVGIVAVVALVVIWLSLQQALTYCDWIELLAASDQLLEDARRFLAEDTAALIADLPESAQVPASAVVTAARLFLDAVALVRDALLGPLREAILVMASVCNTL